MKILQTTSQTTSIEFSAHELLIVNNALNEICHGIDLGEFDTRIGASLNETKALLNSIGEAITESGA